MDLKYELQRIISGVSKNSEGSVIKAAAYYLGKSKETSGNAQENEFTKGQETKELISWIEESNLWFSGPDESRFIARGTEQRVYLDTDV
jgi:hypothetical protein